MIIFGTRGVTTTPQRGSFHCPQCGAQRSYNYKRVRRFFTLYFIPLIPLDKLGEYVECPMCQGTFDPAVLNYDPANEALEIQAYFFIAVKQVMIAMLLADGVIDDSEVVMLQARYKEITGVEIPEDELREEIAVINASGSSALELVQNIAPQLNDSGKEIVMRAAYAIAAADGHIDVTEQTLMTQIGQALGLTQAHLAGIIHSLTAPPATPPPLETQG